MTERDPSWSQQLSLLRPYLVALVLVAVVAFTAARPSDRSEQASTSPGGVRASTEDTLGAVPSGSAAPAAAGTEATGTGGPSSAESPAAAPVGPGGAAFPGLGSEGALASARCDRARDRIRVQYLRAPRCVAPWPKGGDNGGATSFGVSGDLIKFVVYLDAQSIAAGGAGGGGTSVRDARQALVDGFEAAFDVFEGTYETWGRKVQLVFYDASGNDEASMRNDAVDIATRIKPFGLYEITSVKHALYEALVAKGIMVFTNIVSERDSVKQAPFRWSTGLPSDELNMRHVAEYIGKRLQGPAKYAGDPVMVQQARKYGLVHPEKWDVGVIESELGKHRVQLTDKVSYDPNNYAANLERARTVAARLKAAGVTTVIAGSDLIFTAILTRAATLQGWFPEWVMTGTIGQDLDLFARVFDQQQWSHAFGLAATAPSSSLGSAEAELFTWYFGSRENYVGLAMSAAATVMSGVHGAGPLLNPTTFRDGLFALPPSGGSTCACVLSPQFSWGRWGVTADADYGAVDDFAEVWWDPDLSGPCNAEMCESGQGKYRYVEGGRRRLLGRWPATPATPFDEAGTVGHVTTPSGAERPPRYPCNGCPSSGR